MKSCHAAHAARHDIAHAARHAWNMTHLVTVYYIRNKINNFYL